MRSATDSDGGDADSEMSGESERVDGDGFSSVLINEDGQCRAFEHFIKNIRMSVGDVSAVIEHGSWYVVVMAYFLMYQCLCPINKARCRPVDHSTIHELVLKTINDSAAGNFDTIFNALYR